MPIVFFPKRRAETGRNRGRGVEATLTTPGKEPTVAQVVLLNHHRAKREAAEGNVARAAKVDALRQAWLEGRLDLSISENARGWVRFLEDVLWR